MSPSHLYGQMAPVDGARRDRRGTWLVIIEDAAQSQGATRNGRGRRLASGVAAGTSFYPGKNLGAYGDARRGAHRRRRRGGDGARARRNHGGAEQVRARRRRLQLPPRHPAGRRAAREAAPAGRVERAAARRGRPLRRAARRPDGVALPGRRRGNEQVWHLYVVRVDRTRPRARGRCDADGIGAGIHYPAPVHLQPALRRPRPRPGRSRWPRRAASRILSLPMFPGITAAQQERVAEVLVRFS